MNYISHERTRPRSCPQVRPYQVWLQSEKNCSRESVNGFVSTDGQTERRTISFQYTPLSTSLSGGIIIVMVSTFIVIGGNRDCRDNNLRCHQCRQSWHHDNLGAVRDDKVGIITTLESQYSRVVMMPTLYCIITSPNPGQGTADSQSQDYRVIVSYLLWHNARDGLSIIWPVEAEPIFPIPGYEINHSSCDCPDAMATVAGSINTLKPRNNSHCMHITVTPKWARRRLKSPASTQPFVQPQIK